VEILDKMAFVSRIELIKKHAIAVVLGIDAARNGRFSSIGKRVAEFLQYVV
jgi:hypothetical protein